MEKKQNQSDSNEISREIKKLMDSLETILAEFSGEKIYGQDCKTIHLQQISQEIKKIMDSFEITLSASSDEKMYDRYVEEKDQINEFLDIFLNSTDPAQDIQKLRNSLELALSDSTDEKRVAPGKKMCLEDFYVNLEERTGQKALAEKLRPLKSTKKSLLGEKKILFVLGTSIFCYLCCFFWPAAQIKNGFPDSIPQINPLSEKQDKVFSQETKQSVTKQEKMSELQKFLMEKAPAPENLAMRLTYLIENKKLSAHDLPILHELYQQHRNDQRLSKIVLSAIVRLGTRAADQWLSVALKSLQIEKATSIPIIWPFCKESTKKIILSDFAQDTSKDNLRVADFLIEAEPVSEEVKGILVEKFQKMADETSRIRILRNMAKMKIAQHDFFFKVASSTEEAQNVRWIALDSIMSNLDHVELSEEGKIGFVLRLVRLENQSSQDEVFRLKVREVIEHIMR